MSSKYKSVEYDYLHLSRTSYPILLELIFLNYSHLEVRRWCKLVSKIPVQPMKMVKHLRIMNPMLEEVLGVE